MESPALVPVQISMVTQCAWTPLGAAKPVVVRVTQFCRMACVCPGRSVAANTTTALPLVRHTKSLHANGDGNIFMGNLAHICLLM